MNLLQIEAAAPKSFFEGKQPPRSLKQFFSEVLDRGLLEGSFSNGRMGDIRHTLPDFT